MLRCVALFVVSYVALFVVSYVALFVVSYVALLVVSYVVDVYLHSQIDTVRCQVHVHVHVHMYIQCTYMYIQCTCTCTYYIHVHVHTMQGVSSDGENCGGTGEGVREESSVRSGRGSAMRDTPSLSDGIRTPKPASRTGFTFRTPRARSRTDGDVRTPPSSRTHATPRQYVNESRPTASGVVRGRKREENNSHTRAEEMAEDGRGTREPRVLQLETSESSSGGVAVGVSSPSEGSPTPTDADSTIDEYQVQCTHVYTCIHMYTFAFTHYVLCILALYTNCRWMVSRM